MNYSKINVGGCDIAYIEVNPSSDKTIFFLPGNSVSKKIWVGQLNNKALSHYRLIAFDFPANGDSDSCGADNYTLLGLAKIIYNAIEQLYHNRPFIVAGISLGTNVLAEMLAFPLLPQGIILTGPSIFGINCKVENIAKPGTHVGVVFVDNSVDEDIIAYSKEVMLLPNEKNIEMFVNDYRKVQAPFRSALAASIMRGDYNDEVGLIKKADIPSLIVFGEDELVVNNSYLNNEQLPLWNNRIYKINGASHFPNIDKPAEYNDLLRTFADDVFK